MHDHDNDGGGYWRGLVTGVLLGAGAALLLAPRKGEELREEIVQGATALKERGESAIETAAIATMVKVDDVRDAIAHRGDAAQSGDGAQSDDALAGSLDDAAEVAAEITDEADAGAEKKDAA